MCDTSTTKTLENATWIDSFQNRNANKRPERSQELQEATVQTVTSTRIITVLPAPPTYADIFSEKTTAEDRHM